MEEPSLEPRVPSKTPTPVWKTANRSPAQQLDATARRLSCTARSSGPLHVGRQAAALRANPRLRIYDNSARFVTCCYDQSKALCHPDRLGPNGTDETPDINHCQPNCGNIARTDRNIEQAADTIKQYEAEMASPLTPRTAPRTAGPTHHRPADDHRDPHRTDKR